MIFRIKSSKSSKMIKMIFFQVQKYMLNKSIKSTKSIKKPHNISFYQLKLTMDDFSIKAGFSQLGRSFPENQKPKEQQQENDVECCETKICIWNQDEYEQFDSDYLNQIFPFKINKNTMLPGVKFIFHFLASSMRYWIELVEEPENISPAINHQNTQKQQSTPNPQPKKQSEPQPEKLGLKHTKFLKNLFQTDESDNYIAFNRWGQYFMEKDQFMKHQEQEANWQPPEGGQLIHIYSRNGEEFQIIKYLGNNKKFCEFKEFMQVMFLFYIDGVSFVKEQVDTWVYFLVFKKVQQRRLFVGALSKYVFKLSTVKQRHRISQVFILPSYQKYGHGKELLDVVYRRSLEDNNCFEITTEIPSFEYQCLRDYKQTEMILESGIIDASTIKVPTTAGEITKVRDQLLGKEVLREIKLKLKLPGHQIQRIAQILVFEKILATKDDMARAHFQEYLRQKIIFNRSPFKSRSKLPHITFFGESPQMKQFYLEKAKEDFLRNQEEIQEILTETINGYERVIAKLRRMKKVEWSE